MLPMCRTIVLVVSNLASVFMIFNLLSSNSFYLATARFSYLSSIIVHSEYLFFELSVPAHLFCASSHSRMKKKNTNCCTQSDLRILNNLEQTCISLYAVSTNKNKLKGIYNQKTFKFIHSMLPMHVCKKNLLFQPKSRTSCRKLLDLNAASIEATYNRQ